MAQNVMEKTADHITESVQQASRATGAVADAIEGGIGAVRRAARQSGDVAEELLNDTTQRIQRHPMLALATTFAAGLSAGVLIAWMIKRR